MNFKTLIFLAGAVALATACEGEDCSSNMMAEDASEQLAEKRNCNAVNPKLCASCRGAGARRARRWRQIVSWRNAQRQALSKWWSGRLRYR